MSCVTGFMLMLTSAIAGADSTSIESRLRADSNLSLFTKAMDIAHYWEQLAAHESITLFIPTDQAMAVEGSDFLLKSVLMTRENRQRLEALVSAHMVVGAEALGFDEGTTTLLTESGECLQIAQVGDATRVGLEARVLSDEKVAGARLLTIDRLLIPDYRSAQECSGE